MPASPGGRTVRLDLLMVERGLAESRTAAQALVLAGKVRIAGRVVDKPGTRIRDDVPLELESPRRWVSRGGDKLSGALARLGVEVAGKRALDVGASTGGFTQVLLEAGATEVVALDVGRGQLDWRLRSDPRVRVLEGVNARHLRPADLPYAPTLAVADVSFISLEKVLPAVFACLPAGGEVVALVKPQFEVGKDSVGRGGIVKDPRLHRAVLLRIAAFVAASGASVQALAPSPLPGAEGNLEFFLRISIAPGGIGADRIEAEVDRVLQEVAR